jgi:glycosyltransferase involved in cell wall biosynthesis
MHDRCLRGRTCAPQASTGGLDPEHVTRPPLTALVSSRNEGHLLGRCLDSIAFCDEIIVIDIDSDDDTAEVARKHGARVLRHPWVPIAERARLELGGEARNEWLLFLDPDEVFAPRLAMQVGALLSTLAPDVAVVDCPWQFYFRDKPLRGTIWGGVTFKRTLARRGAAELRPTVHSGTRPIEGFRAETIAFDGENAIAHYWSSDYRSLVEKHLRYLRLEGPDRLSQGMVTGYKDIVRTPAPAFWQSFITRRGYRDGVDGLLLSVLWSAYSTGAKIALLRELHRCRS